MKLNLKEVFDVNGYCAQPCPNCGGKVKITSSRDCSVHSTYAACTNCDGEYFYTEAEAFSERSDYQLQTDAEVVAIKYYNWAKKDNILGYRCDGEWD